MPNSRHLWTPPPAEVTHPRGLAEVAAAYLARQEASHVFMAFVDGELVTVWGGVVYTAEEVEELAEAYPRIGNSAVTIWDGFYLGPLRPADLPDDAELFNHSCDPNAGVRGQAILVARRDIRPNDEVTFDYQTTETGGMAVFECRCGAVWCRGQIDGTAWQDPAFRQRHTGYLTEHIDPMTP